MYIVLAIILFGILIAIHEFGHFIAAKSLGVKVNEFAIGMGPAIFKRQRGETLYALRCLPIGGYCAMEGEDEATEDPRSFSSQKGWKQLIILCAGSFMNFLIGFVFILIVYSQATGFHTPVIASFLDGCPYEGEDMLMVGDEIYSVDGHRTWFSSDVATFLSRGDGVYDIVVIRDGEKVTIEDFAFTPRDYEGYDTQKYGLVYEIQPKTVANSIENAWHTSLSFVRDVFLALEDLITGAVGLDQMTGIVGIVDTINTVGQETEASEGVASALYEIIYLTAFIAINLAVMNMLPIPALDGGRVFFLAVNWLVRVFTRKTIPAKFEAYVNAACFVLLLGLMAVVMYNDIARIVTS